MDVQPILEGLSSQDSLPVEAIRAAEADRARMVPAFLQAVEAFISASSEERAKPSPIFFIFHLLGSWREKSAYRPLARLLRCPGEDLDGVFGDAITVTIGRIMAAVFDGDPQPLYGVIHDTNADDFVRSAMCETLAMVTLQGDLPRAEATRFLMAGFVDIKPQSNCFVWHGWQMGIAALGLTELRSLVQRAFERGSLDRDWLTPKHFEKDLKTAIDEPDAPPWFVKEHPPFDDVIEEFSSWAGFNPERAAEMDRTAAELRKAAEVHESLWDDSDGPALNRFRDVGRNDPCPCGSGKKFKKCCLDASRDAPYQGEAA
jgi:hypothetical protein